MYSMKREYNEKRNYIRMKVDAPVNVKVHTDGNVLQGVCRDLSGGGLQVELDKALPSGTKVEVVIASAHGHNPMLKAIATVTRVISQPTSGESPCLIGMEITEVLN
ncbi:MAG: pilus assembly protein PilZ [Alteromonadaceae bacterium]|nr:MAG: pilus assembly protein PilZ [Alteromonadaceae bacterium]